MKKKILLMPSPPASGSIGSSVKCLGIARELSKRDCECAFVMGGTLGAFFRDKGYRVYDFPVPVTRKTLGPVNNVIEFLEWTGLLDAEFMDMAVEKELEAIRRFKPDVIFSETRPSAGISLQAEQIPYAAVVSGPCQPEFAICAQAQVQSAIDQIGTIRKKYGLAPIRNPAELLTAGAKIQISPSIPELEPVLAGRKDILYTGHALDFGYDEAYQEEEALNTWLERQSGRTIIMVYLSVGAIAPSLYHNILSDTFLGSQMSVVCCCGNHYQLKDFRNNPKSNLFFSRYIPLNKLQSKVSFLLFHGGQDTMMFSLLNQIPSLCFPGRHFERRYNAEQLQKLGISRRCELFTFRPSSLKHTIQQLMETPTEVMEHWSQIVQSYGGLTRCVDALLEL